MSDHVPVWLINATDQAGELRQLLEALSMALQGLMISEERDALSALVVVTRDLSKALKESLEAELARTRRDGDALSAA